MQQFGYQKSIEGINSSSIAFVTSNEENNDKIIKINKTALPNFLFNNDKDDDEDEVKSFKNSCDDLINERIQNWINEAYKMENNLENPIVENLFIKKTERELREYLNRISPKAIESYKFYFKSSSTQITSLTGRTQSSATEENKFEMTSMSEYRDRSWCIGVPINFILYNNSYEILIYSYQEGVQIINVDLKMVTKTVKDCGMLKYRWIKEIGKVEIFPICTTLPSTGILSVKIRFDKAAELKLYGLINFVDFLKNENSRIAPSVIWTDAVGPIQLYGSERSNICRRHFYKESDLFSPLRLCHLSIRGDIKLNSPIGSHVKWEIVSIKEIIEERINSRIKIGPHLWPARVLRFDDLIMTKNNNYGFFFQSISNSSVTVFANFNMKGIIYSAGPNYAENGVMTAVVFPIYNKESMYEALIIGPLTVVMIITEGRLLNYCPKTWPPSIQKIINKYENDRNRHLEKKLNVAKLYSNYSADLIDIIDRFNYDKLPPFSKTKFGSFELLV